MLSGTVALLLCVGGVVEGGGACVCVCMRVTVGMAEGEVGHYSQELGNHRSNRGKGVKGAVCNAPS